MVNHAEPLRAELDQLNELDGPAFKISKDPGMTPVGRLLRRFSRDEVPQLWNFLRGDLSFVGQRPAIPEEVEKYEPRQRRPEVHPQSAGLRVEQNAYQGLAYLAFGERVRSLKREIGEIPWKLG